MNGETRPAEHRRYPRAQLAHPIRFRHQGELRDGTLRDLSEGGALLACPEPLEDGESLHLHLPLDSWRGSPDACDLDGMVVRSAGSQVAVIFPDRLLPRNRLLLRDFVWRSLRDSL